MRFLVILGLTGCSGMGGDLMAGADVDGDSDSDRDLDGGPGGDADSDTDDFGKRGEGPDLEVDGPATACADGLDNDEDGLSDCAEPTCLRAAECCSGDTLALSDPFEGVDVDLGTWSRFGEPSPQVTSGWLLPNGDALFDSGILSRAALDPAMEIVVSATVEVPADCADLCLETVGVGLTDRASLGTETGVDPVASVVLSADGGHLMLVADGHLVAETWGVASGSQVGVRLGSDGRVEALVGGEISLSAPAGTVSVASPLHAALYGRSPVGTARVDDVQVSTRACASPAGGLRAAAPVLAPRAGSWDDASVTAPAALLDEGGGVVVYYETPTGIGRAVSPDGVSFDRQPTEGPVLSGDYGAPSAVAHTGVVWLAVDAPVEGGVARGIQVFASTSAVGDDFPAAPLVTIDPSDGFASFEDPALVDVDGAALLYLTLADEMGVTSIGRIPLDAITGAPGPLSVILEPDLEGLVAPDGVAAPHVTAERGWLEMWFEERNGLDTRIGYAASGDGVWFEPFDETVLDPSVSAWDALSVGDPTAVTKDGALLLYYAGRDGSAESIGLVTRVLPW